MAGLESLLLRRVIDGRYRIDEVIGRGGMGVVYRATDERLDRTVAVKVVSVSVPPTEIDNLRARFSREARAAARLCHGNIVTIHDYGTDQELSLDYIVMELLEGEDLAAYIAAAIPPPVSWSCAVLLEAARGLGCGHRAGLIHRDVKPRNIFVARRADEDKVRAVVLDFGIAQIVDVEHTATHLTRFGNHPHSPQYASPEQINGDPNLGPETDVFSLAATGFHLLTRHKLAFPADRGSMREQIQRGFTMARQNGLIIPGRVEDVIRQGLEYDPVSRFREAGAFARALASSMPNDDLIADIVPAVEVGGNGRARSMPLQEEAPEPTGGAYFDSPPGRGLGAPRVSSPMSGAMPGQGVIGPPPATGAFPFFPVATHKFILMSIFTLGFYEVYWVYQNWKRVRAVSGQRLSPFWRTVLAPLSGFFLFRRVSASASSNGVRTGWSSSALGILYLGSWLSWGLPEPWKWIGLLSWVPIVRVQLTAQRINDRHASSVVETRNDQYSFANVALIVIGGLLFMLRLVGADLGYF